MIELNVKTINKKNIQKTTIQMENSVEVFIFNEMA